MDLKDYSTKELRAELKRRSDLTKAEKAKIKKCKICKHWGEINYFGESPKNGILYGFTDAVNFSNIKQENITMHTAHLSLLASILKKKGKHYDTRRRNKVCK